MAGLTLANQQEASPAGDSQERKLAQILRANPGSEPVADLDWVLGIYNRGREIFSKFWRNCRMADEFYNGEYNFAVPRGGTMLKLGTFRSVVKTGVDHIAPSFMDVTVPPRSPRALAAAELTEKFLTGSNHMAEQKTPTRREIVKHQFLYGVAWKKTEFDGSMWGDIPAPPEEGEDDSDYREAVSAIIEARDFNFPFASQVINPQEAMWDMNPIEPRWFLRFADIDASWVSAHFPGWRRRSPSGKVLFIEFWTKTWSAYIADNLWAMAPRRHAYGILPFTRYWPQTGITTVGRKPEDLYQGIGHANWSMLMAQSQLASQFVDITRKQAWPSREFIGPASLVAEVRDNYSDEPGSMNHVLPGVEVKVSQVAEAPQSIIAAKDMIDDALEEATVSKVARGQRPTGAASGYMVASLAGIASLNFGSVKESTESGIARDNELYLRIVENVIRDSVTVWGKTEAGSLDATIKPRDIRGHYVNIVRLNTVSPEEQERKVNLWSNQWRSGFVDHQTALRNAGVSNPLEVSARIGAEEFFKNPLVQQAFAQIAASSIPLLQQALAAAQNPAEPDPAQTAENILNTQGQTQLPNPGNFSLGNQASTGAPPAPGGGIPSTVRPVIPGSLQEVDLLGRQLSVPRSGNVRVPGGALAPGGGVA